MLDKNSRRRFLEAGIMTRSFPWLELVMRIGDNFSSTFLELISHKEEAMKKVSLGNAHHELSRLPDLLNGLGIHQA